MWLQLFVFPPFPPAVYVLLVSLKVFLIHCSSRFFSVWRMVRHCLDYSFFFFVFLLLVGGAHVHATFWPETLPLASVLLPLSSLLDCSSEAEDSESCISRGKYENLKALQ